MQFDGMVINQERLIQNPNDLKNLDSAKPKLLLDRPPRLWQEFPGLQRRIIVYPEGEAVKTKDDIEGLSFGRFAERLARGTLFG
jgi:hypothetical protein